MCLCTDIQRFSLHDGPGIRTTVFFKGCSLRCPWCCNPETQSPQIQEYEKAGIIGVYGKKYSSRELFDEVIKDVAYYNGQIFYEQFEQITKDNFEELPGGVTFSGGEALLQFPSIIECLELLKEKHIHIVLETCLYVPKNNLLLGIQYVNLFYVDLKILDVHRCKDNLKGDINVFKDNFKILLESGKPIVIRIPVIGGYTDDAQNIDDVIKYLQGIREFKNIVKIELIKGHNLGEDKYKTMNLSSPRFIDVSDDFMQSYKERIGAIGFYTDICKI